MRRYRAYLANDITPVMGAMPLMALSRDDIAAWVNAMVDDGLQARPSRTNNASCPAR